jgi:hypothetical protein
MIRLFQVAGIFGSASLRVNRASDEICLAIFDKSA